MPSWSEYSNDEPLEAPTRYDMKPVAGKQYFHCLKQQGPGNGNTIVARPTRKAAVPTPQGSIDPVEKREVERVGNVERAALSLAIGDAAIGP
jgi:hypothetical protein